LGEELLRRKLQQIDPVLADYLTHLLTGQAIGSLSEGGSPQPGSLVAQLHQQQQQQDGGEVAMLATPQQLGSGPR
jgi:hypothetical protein